MNTQHCPRTALFRVITSRVVLVIAASLTQVFLISGSAQAAPPLASVEVAPGSTVRWYAEGTQTCHMDDRSWGARGGVCFVPVDLIRTENIEVMRTLSDGRHEKLSLKIGKYPYDIQRLTVADSHVNLSPENLKRADRESGRIAELWPLETEPKFDLPLLPPLEKLGTGGRFGARRIINGEPRSPHTGRDYSAGRGTPVRSTAAGKVVLAEEHFFAGNSVFVDHGEGLISMYFHLDSINVAKGQDVERGQTVGKVGSTGRSTGPHLHFGLRWHGARVDPVHLLASPDGLKQLP